VLDTHYTAEYFIEKAKDSLVNFVTPRVVDEHGLIPLGEASFDVTDDLEDGQAFSYSVSFEVKPEFALSNYDAVRIKFPSTGASEEEIDEQVDTLRSYYAVENVITDRPVKDGDTATIILELSENDKKLAVVKDEAQPYELGSKALPESFERELVGMNVDEEKEFDFDVEDNANLKTATSEDKLHAKVKVVSISERTLPELTDEWIKETAQYEDLAELRDRLAKVITSQKESTADRIKNVEILRSLSKRLQGEPTEKLIEATEADLYQEFFNFIQQQGITFDQYLQSTGLSADGFKADTHDRAIQRAKENLALDAFARELEIDVTELDLDEELRTAGIEDTAAKLIELEENSRMAILKESILRDKIAKYLMGTVEVEILSAGEKIPDDYSESDVVPSLVEPEQANCAADDAAAADDPDASADTAPADSDTDPADSSEN
jgi:trigger factor